MHAFTKMDGSMQLFAMGFLLGDLALMLWHQLPSFLGLILIITVLGIFSVVCRVFEIFGAVLLLGIGLGFSWTWLAAYQQWQQILPMDMARQTVLVQGTIVSVPEQLVDAERFEFKIKHLTRDGIEQKNPGLVRLTWQGLSPQTEFLQPGGYWQLNVRLKPPHATYNPGAFDYEAWLFSHQIHAQGYVVPNSNNQLLQAKKSSAWLNQTRQKLVHAIQADLNNNPYTGFITALSVGVRSQITPAQWQTMQNTGTNHLMAIAGLHIGLVASFVFFFMSFCWRRSEKLMLWLPTPIVAAFASLIAATLFSALAGFSLPTQRAIIMLTVFMLGVLLRRKLPKWHAYFFGLLLVLLWDPLTPLDPSFWLSFGAVALIIYAMTDFSYQNKIKTKVHYFLYIQWLLAIGLIPLTLIFFQEISLAGFIANVIAIPLIGFIVLPLCLLGVLVWPCWSMLAAKIWLLAATVCSWGWPVIAKIGAIHSLQWHGNANYLIALILSMLSVLWLLHPKISHWRWFGLLGFAPIFFWPAPTPKSDEVWFTLLDVGEGLASVVQTQHHVLIYDTGPRFSPTDDAGKSTVVPFLRTRDVKVIDMMVVSHSDEDHSGGAASILQALPVKQIQTSIPSLFPHTNAQNCIAGHAWNWDGVHFEFLYPPANQPYADNNSSCVLKITTGTHSLLLTGDIERESEEYLVNHDINQLSSDIIVAPHHGSGTSSSPNFIAAVKPSYVLFPVGYLNRFHFPNPKVLAHYQQLNAQTFATDDLGAIFVDMNTNVISKPQSYREMNRHFWNY